MGGRPRSARSAAERQGRLQALGDIGGRSDADVGRAAAWRRNTGRAGARPEPARPGARMRPRAAARTPQSPWRCKMSSGGHHVPEIQARGGQEPATAGACGLTSSRPPGRLWRCQLTSTGWRRTEQADARRGLPPSEDAGAGGMADLAPASWPSGRLTLNHPVRLSPTPWLRQRRGRGSPDQRPQPGPRAWTEMSGSGGRCGRP